MSIILRALKKVQDQKAARPPAQPDAESGKLAEPVRDGPSSQPDEASTSTRSGPPAASARAAAGHNRFGVGPKVLLGLMAVLGVVTSGWFFSRIYVGFNPPTAEPPATNPPITEKLAAPSVEQPPPAPAAPAAATTPAAQTARASVSEPPAEPVVDVAGESASARVKPVAQTAEAAPPQREEKEPAPEVEGPKKLKINAIAWKAAEPKAIVNMQRVYVGDVIEGATVIAIRRKSILFRRDGERFEVRF